MEEKKKNQSKEKRNLKLSTKMSLILGLISALAFLFYGIVLIHYSKTYVDKMIDGNMVDKSHMAMNDVDNILVNAETIAETIKDSVTASYEADAKGTDDVWTVVNSDGNPIKTTAMGPAVFQSKVKNAVLTKSQYASENALINSLYAAVNSNEDLFGVGVYFEPNGFVKGIDDYSMYISRDDAKNRKVETYNASYQEGDDYKKVKESKKTQVTSIYQDVYTKDWVFSINVPIVVNDEYKGFVLVDMGLSTFEILQQKDSRFPSLYVNMLDGSGNIAYSMHKDVIAKPFKDTVSKETYETIAKGMEGGKSFHVVTNSKKNGKVVRYISPFSVGDKNWWIGVTISEAEYNQAKNSLILLSNMVTLIAVLVLAGLTHFFVRRSLKPLQNISSAGLKVAEGDFDVEIAYKKKDEIGLLADSMKEIMDRIRAIIADLQEKLAELAKGNYRVDMSDEQYYQGAYFPLLKSLREISRDLSNTMKGIVNSANQVSLGAEQVSNASQTLSQGATEQASSIEELSATMDDISGKISNTAKVSEEVAQLSNESEKAVSLSNQKMSDMSKAMADITEKSNEISKIIKTIDDIAFQTNILSLNAAIEAARAGAAGKGFAVVADEVGNLAQKSAKAAQNTSVLIEETIDAVNKGAKISEETAESLNVVAAQTKKINHFITDISAASDEQAKGVKQVSIGIDQISSVVQSNSATAEESAASAEELYGQANLLNNLMERFILQEETEQVAAKKVEKAEPEKKEEKKEAEKEASFDKKATVEKKEKNVVKAQAKKENTVSKGTEKKADKADLQEKPHEEKKQEEKKPVSRKTVSVKKEETEPYVVEEGIDLTTVPEPKTPPKEFAETKRDAWTVDSFGSDKY